MMKKRLMNETSLAMLIAMHVANHHGVITPAREREIAHKVLAVALKSDIIPGEYYYRASCQLIREAADLYKAHIPLKVIL